MKRIIGGLLFISVLVIFISSNTYAANVSGVWRGRFNVDIIVSLTLEQKVTKVKGSAIDDYGIHFYTVKGKMKGNTIKLTVINTSDFGEIDYCTVNYTGTVDGDIMNLNVDEVVCINSYFEGEYRDTVFARMYKCN